MDRPTKAEYAGAASFHERFAQAADRLMADPTVKRGKRKLAEDAQAARRLAEKCREQAK